MTDNKGRTVNFRNTIIIMTSNLGSSLIRDSYGEHGIDEKSEIKLKEELIQLLRTTLKPEFVNRVDEIVMFKPLTLKEITEIVRLQINRVSGMLIEKGIYF